MTISKLIPAAAMILTMSPLSAQERRQQPSDSLKSFLLPAVTMGGDTVGSLILGQTTLKEALRILPPFEGHGPSKPNLCIRDPQR